MRHLSAQVGAQNCYYMIEDTYIPWHIIRRTRCAAHGCTDAARGSVSRNPWRQSVATQTRGARNACTCYVLLTTCTQLSVCGNGAGPCTSNRPRCCARTAHAFQVSYRIQGFPDLSLRVFAAGVQAAGPRGPLPRPLLERAARVSERVLPTAGSLQRLRLRAPM